MATKAIKTSKKLQRWQTWPSWPFSLAEFMASKATIRNESNLGFIKMASLAGKARIFNKDIFHMSNLKIENELRVKV